MRTESVYLFRKSILVSACMLVLFGSTGACEESMGKNVSIIFLHHSTGHGVWRNGVPEWFARYNADNGTNYQIIERSYPKGDPYKWKNYPFDYWNIWIKNEGFKPYMEEPTLETLTQLFNVVVFKHCFPVSNIEADAGSPDITSEKKTLGNYKIQYAALKKKLHSYQGIRFIVWTGAALVRENTNEENAKRAKEFFAWVKNEWDEKGDNIYVWDFWELETEGGIYLKDNYARALDNSHPNDEFDRRVAPYFCTRIVDVIAGKGDSTSLTGK